MISVVIESLKKASEEKPLTKDRLHSTLMKKWSDHNEKSVRDSINWYLATMKKKHDLVVQKNESGYWIEA